jgi:hypothetical protein
MLCPYENFLWKVSWVAVVERNLSVDGEVGDRTQGFRRMAARNKPAGIRSLVYGIGKGKVRIEGLSVSAATLISDLRTQFL